MEQDQNIHGALAAFQQGDLDRARALAEAQLAKEPNLPVLQHLLGLIECRQGEVEGGVRWLRRAAEGDPGNVSYRVMLARALIDLGRPAEALDAAGRPTGTGPADLALWHARAEAAQASGDRPNATQAWEILSAAWGVRSAERPDDWRPLANYGDALAGLDRWPEAVSALRKAWLLNPTERPLWRNFASALARAGSYEEAADQLKAMIEAWPEDTDTRLTFAQLLADLGRQEESMAQLDRVAEISAGDATLGRADTGLIRIVLGDSGSDSAAVSGDKTPRLRELAQLLERTNRIEALRNLLDEADAIGLSRELLGYSAAAVALRDGDSLEAQRLLMLDTKTFPARRHRLMAKILDSLDDAEGAFAAAEMMNRSIDDFDNWVRRGVEYRRGIRALTNIVSAEWAATLNPIEPGSRRAPVFLVGFPRSGTTLLDTFLRGHPDVEVIEEHHMLDAAETVLGGSAQLPLRSIEQLKQARDAYFAELDRHADKDFPGLVVDKLPLNMLGLPVIYSLFPEARIIFAQRHPCDAVLSGFMQSFALNDAMACFLTIEGSADLYDAAMTLFMRSRDALPLATHTLVYEEMVTDPERALRPLIEFLGLAWRAELLDHQATAKARGAISTPSYDQVIQPLNRAPSGRWHRYEEQLEPVLPVLLPWAERLGYTD